MVQCLHSIVLEKHQQVKDLSHRWQLLRPAPELIWKATQMYVNQCT